jgi:[protein-PII] uridylyltransferase
MAAPADLKAARSGLVGDRSLSGSAWCERYAGTWDAWLRSLLGEAAGGDQSGLALIAVGGYGRGALAPGSDVDLVLVHNGKRKIGPIADALWYPIWDTGVPLDHSVRTAKEVRAAMDCDIKVALGLLNARLVAGDEKLASEVLAKALDLWSTRVGRWLPSVAGATRQRHARFGDLAFLLEPDLKEARGGLRDMTQLLILARVVPVLAGILDDAELAAASEVLTAARVELHRHTGRPSNTLTLQDQDAVAAALQYPDADALMAAVAKAARAIAWANDDGWRRIESWLAGPRGRGAGGDRPLEAGIVMRDGEIALATGAQPGSDPSLALRLAAASAELDAPISRSTLDRLGEEAAVPAGVWPPEALHALLRLLGAGFPAVAAVEALDQRGLWVRYLPEWEAVRNRPQRNAYHRFTVDRHLVETAAGAADLQARVSRPDLLLLGALLHDIGKGRGGDHTDAGIEVVESLGPRLGLPPADVAMLVSAVRHHLLLPDAATRRDLDDPATAASVAAAVGDRVVLELLAALTEADSIATGPSAWGSWKAGLVAGLVDRTAAILEGRPPPDTRRAQLGPEQLELLSAGELRLLVDGDQLTVAAPDRAGLLAAVAGVLTLAGVVVRSATTMSDPGTGMALLRFEVVPAFDRLPDWDRVRRDLDAGLAGRLSIGQLLDEREAHYSRHRRRTAAHTPEIAVIVDNEASAESSVVEVRAPDKGPVLYRLASTLTAAGLVISCALVNTLGAEAVDVFYVQTLDGKKLIDEDHQARVTDAVRSALRH